MRVAFHGVRGSTPCHGDEVRRYGGNTSCVSITVPDGPPVILDMGTGARYLGLQQTQAPFYAVCLLSHLHWDHLQGMPFFAPLLRADTQIDLHGPRQPDGRALAEVLSMSVCPPLFPLDIAEFPAMIRCHDTDDETFTYDSLTVTARYVPHIGATLGFRVEWNGASVAYLPDHQQPADGGLTIAAGALELAAGVDVLIHDAQYTPDEFAAKRDWGHCTVDYAVELARRCGVKRLVLFHHDPCRSDDALDELTAATAARAGVDVVAAAEGLTLELG